MKFPLNIKGYEKDKIVVLGSGVFRGPRLLVNNLPARKGPRRYQYILRNAEGMQTIVVVRPRFFLDPVPQVLVDDNEIILAEPLKIFQMLWSSLPFLIFFIGGLPGWLFGAIAAWLNVLIFRSNEVGKTEKYVLSGIVTIIAFALWALVLFLLASYFVNNA